MGWREPLDLSDILKNYEEFGGSSTAGITIGDGSQWWQQAPNFFNDEARREAARQRQENEPQFSGTGPAACSTSMALVPSPQWCWDVLGYYKALGVHWKATKKELMEAFMALGPMPTAYQMHCLKQLLNPEIRRSYDSCPLGTIFLNDSYVQDMLKKKAAAEAKRRTEAGVPTTAQEVINENFKFEPDTPDEVVDSEGSNPEDAELSDPAPTVFSWPYGYFLWKTKEPDTTEHLAQWQALLVREFSSRGEVLDLAVGLVGRMAHRYVVGRIGSQYVVFLGDGQTPTEELAGSAAEALLQDMHQTSTTS